MKYNTKQVTRTSFFYLSTSNKQDIGAQRIISNRFAVSYDKYYSL